MSGGRVGIVDRLWKRIAGGGSAEKAELAGDLARAAVLWARIGAHDEVARVMVLRGDAEPDPKARLAHYTQAAATAARDGAIGRGARAKRASLAVLLARDGAPSAARTHDLLEAARELEALGDAEGAAAAYALAGDADGEARALALGGEVERLDALLERDHARTRNERRALDLHASIDAAISAGERRHALALAEAAEGDPRALAQAARLRGGRIAGALVPIALRGAPVVLVPGREVEIGRTDGAIRVPAGAVSRRHLRVRRDGVAIVVEDLGSHNGTLVGGLKLAHPLALGDAPLALMLGGEIPVVVAKTSAFGDGVSIEVGGERYVAPLGDALMPVAGWRLTRGDDGWVELVTEPGHAPYMGPLELTSVVQLLRGDAFSATRGSEVVLRMRE